MAERLAVPYVTTVTVATSPTLSARIRFTGGAVVYLVQMYYCARNAPSSTGLKSLNPKGSELRVSLSPMTAEQVGRGGLTVWGHLQVGYLRSFGEGGRVSLANYADSWLS